MTPNSMQVNQYNSVDDWGVRIIKYDPGMPEKRQNKITIPFVNGAYKPPGKYYNERIIPVDCIMTRKISRFDLRQIFGILSNPCSLYFWDEPNLHYKSAEVFSNVELDTWQAEAGREFTLEFVCYPFALAETSAIPIQTGINKPDYNGTYEAPAMIVLENKNTFNVSNVRITIVKRSVV